MKWPIVDAKIVIDTQQMEINQTMVYRLRNEYPDVKVQVIK